MSPKIYSYGRKKSDYHTKSDIRGLTDSVLKALRSIPSRFQMSLAAEVQELLDMFDKDGRPTERNFRSTNRYRTSKVIGSLLKRKEEDMVRLSTGIRRLLQSVEESEGATFVQSWIRDLRQSFGDWASSTLPVPYSTEAGPSDEVLTELEDL
ncbi:hypothetical protein FRB94_011681 [Tulasnella sp. JGI-2019a]|nr:hypothetical protein FRB94_011681 [Tulasnella sp. JGI-2019a]